MSTSLVNSVDAPAPRDRIACPTRPKSDSINVALTVSSRLVYAGSQAVVLVLIARLSGTQDLASFVWAMALTAPIFMFTNMNLLEVISTETAQGYGFSDYWSVRLLSTTFGLIVLTIIVPLVTSTYEWSIIAIVAVGKAVESINDLIIGAYHRYDRADRAAISLILRSVGGCLCLAAILGSTSSVTAGLAGMVFFQLAALIIYDWAYVNRFKAQDSRNATVGIDRLLRKTLPLAFVACLTSLSLNVPRYTVHGHLDDQSLAAFGCCASFLQVFTLVGVAAQLALSPRIAMENASSRQSMNNMLWNNVAIVSCIGVIVVVACHIGGAVALSMFFGRQYSQYGPLLTWLMIAGAFAAAKGFLATGLIVTRSTISQFAIATAQFLCSVVGCLWLVPRHGVIAAAWVVAASSLLSFVLHAIWTIAPKREAVA